MLRLRPVIALMLLLLLPLQSWAAASMLSCPSVAGVSPVASDATAVADGAQAHGHHCGDEASPTGGAHSTSGCRGDCTQCGLCHLACSPALPEAVPPVRDCLAAVMRPHDPSAPASRAAAPPTRPPLSALR